MHGSTTMAQEICRERWYCFWLTKEEKDGTIFDPHHILATKGVSASVGSGKCLEITAGMLFVLI